MGTSISQASPTTANWRAANTAYTSDALPVDRVAQEVWRAATNQPIGDLAVDLASPIIAQCAQIARDAASGTEAIASIRQSIMTAGDTSLAADIAQRAAVRCIAVGGDRIEGFVKSLFSEASNYLVARDLPGFVGRGQRTRAVSDARQFKSDVCRVVGQVVQTVARPPGAEHSPASWNTYVATVVKTLTGT